MSRTVNYSIAFLGVAQIVDGVTTCLALHAGAEEANPIAHVLMECLGEWPAILFVKAPALLLIWGLWEIRSVIVGVRFREWMVGILAAGYAVVIGNNLVVLL